MNLEVLGLPPLIRLHAKAPPAVIAAPFDNAAADPGYVSVSCPQPQCNRKQDLYQQLYNAEQLKRDHIIEDEVLRNL